jgi:putative zinc finger/helix-turn-helix YgiT family protein
MICPACGKQPSHTVEQYQYRESGLNNVFVRGVGIDRCKCGQEYVQLPGAQEVHDQVASALLSKSSLLTGPESKFLRKWLLMTSEEMGKALGYTRVTVSRWENDGLSAKTDRTLRLYASAVRNRAIDFESLFSSMSAKPQRSFRIVVDGAKTVIQSDVLGHVMDSCFSQTLVSAQSTTLSFPFTLSLPLVQMYTVTLKPTDPAAERISEDNNDLALAA